MNDLCNVRSLLIAVAEMHLQALKLTKTINTGQHRRRLADSKGRGSTQGSGENGENDKV